MGCDDECWAQFTFPTSHYVDPQANTVARRNRKNHMAIELAVFVLGQSQNQLITTTASLFSFFSVSSFTRFTNIAFCSVHVAASLSRSKKQKQTASSRSAARFHLSFCRVFFKLENAKQNEMPAATLHACYFDINLNFFFSSRRSAPNTCTRQAKLSKAGERKKLLG